VPDEASQTIERLLSDPGYRLRQAAAWYFEFGSTDEALAGEQAKSHFHDRVLLEWHAIAEGAASGTDMQERFEQACDSTTELLNNPASWRPLEDLVQQIGDARLRTSAVPAAATDAAAGWISEALFGLAESGSHEHAHDAGDAVVAEGLPDEVVDAVTVLVLKRAADELGLAANENEARVLPLLQQIGNNPSLAGGLRAAAQDLVAAARPWWALVDVFDEDPDSGAEGHALDRVARLLRGASVALFNHADDPDAAARLLGFACEIVQTAALKASLKEDQRLVRYRADVSKAIDAVKAGEVARAKAYAVRVTRYASTAEEHAEAAKLEAIVARMELVSRIPAGATAGGSGCGSIVGALVALIVVGSIIAGVVSAASNSNGDSPTSRPPINLPDANTMACTFKQSQLDESAARLDSLQQQLTAIESRYRNSQPPRSVIIEYENLASRHDALVGPHNRLVREFNSQCAK
jgi:hypothetical protein